jgi:hypothetical protein
VPVVAAAAAAAAAGATDESVDAGKTVAAVAAAVSGIAVGDIVDVEQKLLGTGDLGEIIMVVGHRD